MDKLSDDIEENTIEHALIKEAYAATLDPTRLSAFEVFWEAYIDAQTQKDPEGFDWENTPVNSHITMALDILNRVRSVSEKLELAQELVESHYGFGFIIDGEGRIIAANSDAKSVIDHHNHLNDSFIDALGLRKIMSWLESGATEFNFFEVYLYGGSKQDTWFISPIKINRDDSESKDRHFLIASVDTKLSRYAIKTIGKFFELTPAETQVAGLLSDGYSPKEVADKRGVRITAVRTQIANIKDKMGAKDIPDIVRKFVSMNIRASAARSQIRRGEAIRGLKNLSIRQSSMTLGDGRIYQYFEQGDRKGKPILQIHSLMSAVEFPKSVGHKLNTSACRMISPARAGYGKSEPNPKRNMIDVVDSAVDDLIELLDHLGIKNVILLTGWAGPIAQRLALKDSRVKGIVLSGAVPVWRKSYLDSLPPRYRNLLKTSIHAPKAVPYLLRVAKALIDSGNVSTFMRGLHKGNSVDPKGLEKDEDTREAFKTLFPHLSGQGVSAFAGDLPSIHTDWTHDTRKLTIPVTIAMGSKNIAQPPDAVLEYINAAPQTKLVKIEGADSYQNATHFEDILEAVIDMW